MTPKPATKKSKPKATAAKPKPKAVAPINYAAMDQEALKQAADEIHIQLAEKILEESEVLRTAYYAAVRAIDTAMSKHGITAQEFLTFPKARLRKAIVARLRGESPRQLAARFAHPEHPELTWTGRGSRPRWLRNELEKGRDLEEFRVQR